MDERISSVADKTAVRAKRSRRITRAALILFVASSIAFSAVTAGAQQQPLSVRVANAAIERWPQGASKEWDFQLGVVMAGMDAAWRKTGYKAYLQYIQQTIDRFVTPDGLILTYKPEEKSLNNMLLGRELLLLYRTTHEEKYHKAAALLRKQLFSQPHNASGGWWHTQNTPNLMMLDDQYMADPFYAEYAATFNEPQDFAEITKQFVLLDEHARDPRSGLLYHGWDETRTETWVNKTTGTSPNLWARGMGWYMMALVDTLPYYRKNERNSKEQNRERAVLLAILNRTAAALVRRQDPASGLWYQILDRPKEKGNYIESSSVLMITYALAKGVRLGYLPQRYSVNTARAWKGILQRFVQIGPDGAVTVSGTVTGIALGAAPANDGSEAYYLHAPVVSNDPKGIGPFLMASAEMEGHTH